ncbi:CopG family ribbon-helix-helix protein [Rubritalea marina]|uniref:CopG family ribbon-helix-helix protein n=1 Tax=Rubritalea marina TaxID=361055 RepID=UPI0003723286|nr:hypothetical protein [Rubritalea marina]
MQHSKNKVKRVSISLTTEAYEQLDRYTSSKGFQSRSQAIADMIHQSLIATLNPFEDEVAAGTITLVYQESKTDLLHKIAEIERRYINEVISSQHILLENNHTMEVLLVQGPTSTLHSICNQLTSCKGVRTGKLALTTILMPPIHPRITKH